MNAAFTSFCARACLMLAVLLFLALSGVIALVAGVVALRFIVPLMLLAILLHRKRRRPVLPASTEHGSARWCSQEEATHAGLFQPRGLFLGRWAGDRPGRFRALNLLFTLPLSRSAAAVRLFWDAYSPKS